jgi:hypothetical protein
MWYVQVHEYVYRSTLVYSCVFSRMSSNVVKNQSGSIYFFHDMLSCRACDAHQSLCFRMRLARLLHACFAARPSKGSALSRGLPCWLPPALCPESCRSLAAGCGSAVDVLFAGSTCDSGSKTPPDFLGGDDSSQGSEQSEPWEESTKPSASPAAFANTCHVCSSKE